MKKHRRNESGFALLGVLVLSMAAFVFGLSFMALAGSETLSSQRQLDSERAFWLAEAGQQRALLWMKSQPAPTSSSKTLFPNTRAPGGGTYTVTVYPDPDRAWSVEKRFVVESVGESRGVKRRLLQTVKMKSFSLYAYYSEDELGPPDASGKQDLLWFVNGDVIEGPVHSNGTIRVNGSPRFLGHVTSGSPVMQAYENFFVHNSSEFPIGPSYHINNPTFEKGLELGADSLGLPTSTADLREAASTKGWHFKADSQTPPATYLEIQLGKAGTTKAGVASTDSLRWRTTTRNQDWHDMALSEIPDPKVIYSEVDLWISGVLDGEITISSAKDIYIMDDLTYAGSNANGVPSPVCNDLLGLVAGKNIIFKEYSHDPDYGYSPEPWPTDNLKVNAVMMALGTSIKAEGEESGYGTQKRRGSLTIYGGLIQRFRGPVGRHTRNTGALVSGYEKNYHYDERVTARTPPYFPLPGLYEARDWKDTWDEISFPTDAE